MIDVKGELDLSAVQEEWRVISVAEQRRLDARYVWNKDGTEYSGYPEGFEPLVSAVVELLQAYPGEGTKITAAVHDFFKTSRGYGDLDASRSDDVITAYNAEYAKAKFWQRVALGLLPQAQVTPEVDLEHITTTVDDVATTLGTGERA